MTSEDLRPTKPQTSRAKHNLRLEDLDLSHIDLTAYAQPKPKRNLRWLAFVGLFASALFVAIFPETQAYRQVQGQSWVYLVLCTVGMSAGLGLGRCFMRFAEEQAARKGPVVRKAKPRRQGPASLLERNLTLIGALAGAIALLLGAESMQQALPAQVAFGIITLGAIVVGTLAGRWITLQGEAANAKKPKTQRKRSLPPWLKWVNLGFLALLAAFAIALPYLGSLANSDTLNALGGSAGLLIALLGALWIARRFDEAEAAQAKRQQRKQRQSNS